MLEPNSAQHLDNVALLLCKLGWRFNGIEAGLKLFLPVSPFTDRYFNFREKGGGLTPAGGGHGGDMLGRVLSGYLEGTF